VGVRVREGGRADRMRRPRTGLFSNPSPDYLSPNFLGLRNNDFMVLNTFGLSGKYIYIYVDL